MSIIKKQNLEKKRRNKKQSILHLPFFSRYIVIFLLVCVNDRA